MSGELLKCSFSRNGIDTAWIPSRMASASQGGSMRLPSIQDFSHLMRRPWSEPGAQAQRDQRVVLMETAEGARFAVEVMGGDVQFVRFPADVAEFGADIDVVHVEAGGKPHAGFPAPLAKGR